MCRRPSGYGVRQVGLARTLLGVEFGECFRIRLEADHVGAAPAHQTDVGRVAIYRVGAEMDDLLHRVQARCTLK